MKNEIYLIISDKLDPGLSFGEAIRSTTCTATNFKKAYGLAISLGELVEPSIGYRAALNQVNSQYAIQLGCKLGPQKVTIAKVNKW